MQKIAPGSKRNRGRLRHENYTLKRNFTEFWHYQPLGAEPVPRINPPTTWHLAGTSPGRAQSCAVCDRSIK